MPIRWFLISICFYGINFINCMEDAADSNRRGKINCNAGHFCVEDSGEIHFFKIRRKINYFGKFNSDASLVDQTIVNSI